ncbi:MAG TPA: HAD-IIIA family hydrolase [Bacteroidales bacterium]|nr:HAD-IIIA family hydrolase [Bacteroidales bacterium]
MFPRITDPQAWTLFLDRDGVINKKLPGDYVKSWDEFEFLPGVLTSLVQLRKYFNRIVIVTNQQGIGKGIMNFSDLKAIHDQMLDEIEQNGGLIDAIYFCPDLENSLSRNRKPETGMAMRAKKEFPEIEFKNSVMVGDALSDMDFAGKLGMVAVYLGTDKQIIDNNKNKIDYVFNNLKEFADFLYENNQK